jgi:acetyl coenzyme A synthetase (ADP forming)-like protein
MPERRADVSVSESGGLVAAYRAEWAADVVSADGRTVRIRPIRPDDNEKVLQLYERLSPESMYLRFFSPVPAPLALRTDRLTQVDQDEHVVIVAELGDEVVAMARYDRQRPGDTAEVAFVVDDAHQSRGLGTLLLEHLAAIGRGQGLRRFVATTLPQNRRMLAVFRDAGYEVTSHFEKGTIEVSFSIGTTDASLAAQQAREHRAEAESIAGLLTPSSIALIGASRRPGTIGHEILRNLLDGGFTGPVYPVNPNARAVTGVRAYPTIGDVPDDVDLAVVAVPAAEVPVAVRQCAAKAVRSLVIVSAGFAEVGGDQAQAERDLVEIARRNGMRIVGPNCMGVINTSPAVRMNATFAPFVPTPGRIAFSSQSGALGIELLGQAAELGLGISTFVSVGNKADVSGNDLLQYWEEDPDTDVILLYLESFGNPRKFARLARRISRTKPIVAVKSGRTQAGTRAAGSHTAALASSDVAVDALFRQAGVVRVDTLEELFDAAQVLAHQPLPQGRRVAIVSNGGGPAILAADACTGAGLEVPEVGSDTQARLRDFASPDAGVRNPIDLVASATATTYERALRTVLQDDQIDAVIVIFVPPLVTQPDDVARAIRAAAGAAGPKPIVACFLGRHGIPDALRCTQPDERSIPSFAFPESAAAALGHAAGYGSWRRRPEGAVSDFPDMDAEQARAIVGDRVGVSPDGVWLDPDVAQSLCDCFGVPIIRTMLVATTSDAVDAAEELGYPVALKAGSGAIVHKTDVGAVRLNLTSEEEVRDAFTAMQESLGDEMGGAIVQPMVGTGIETIVGVTRDALFGSLVVFGMGGTAAELVRDTALRILPITDLDAREMVRSLRTSPLLFGYRGSPPADVGALEQLLLRVGRLADELPEVAEMDCNPVIVSPDAVTVVDVKIRLVPLPPSPLPGVRRMRSSDLTPPGDSRTAR